MRATRFVGELGGGHCGRKQGVDVLGEGLVGEVDRDEFGEDLELPAQICLEAFDGFPEVVVVAAADLDELVDLLGLDDVRRDCVAGAGGTLSHHRDCGVVVLGRDDPGVVEEEGGAHR